MTHISNKHYRDHQSRPDPKKAKLYSYICQ